MKILALLSVVALASVSFAGDAPNQPTLLVNETTVAQPLAGATYTVALQTSATTPPPIITLTPGASYGFDIVGVLPAKGAKHIPTSACLSTDLVTAPLGRKGWIAFADALAGVSLNNGALTGGWSAGVKYSTSASFLGRGWNGFFKAAFAQLVGAGISPVPGGELAVGLSIATK